MLIGREGRDGEVQHISKLNGKGRRAARLRKRRGIIVRTCVELLYSRKGENKKLRTSRNKGCSKRIAGGDVCFTGGEGRGHGGGREGKEWVPGKKREFATDVKRKGRKAVAISAKGGKKERGSLGGGPRSVKRGGASNGRRRKKVKARFESKKKRERGTYLQGGGWGGRGKKAALVEKRILM